MYTYICRCDDLGSIDIKSLELFDPCIKNVFPFMDHIHMAPCLCKELEELGMTCFVDGDFRIFVFKNGRYNYNITPVMILSEDELSYTD